jgi:general secretion pathway protein A
MYEAFYHLNTNPFRITPDPKFCFRHSGYKSAREYLDYALRLGEGFIMVTGRPGTGKTTLAETFLKDLDLNQVSAKRVAASGLEADGRPGHFGNDGIERTITGYRITESTRSGWRGRQYDSD